MGEQEENSSTEDMSFFILDLDWEEERKQSPLRIPSFRSKNHPGVGLEFIPSL